MNTSRWVLGVALLVFSTGCTSKQAFVTVPNSGNNGTWGDELATKTLTPCNATAKETDTCVLYVTQKDCPFGIGRMKMVRKGSKLEVTPYCFIPTPGAEPGTKLSEASELDAPPTDSSELDAPVDKTSHPDPGDL